jgi:transcriptional regulator with XRE-family HTH domain
MRLRCRLRELRGRRSLSKMAAATEEGGKRIFAGVLSLIERGRMLPADDQLEAIAAAYGEDIESWYDWRGPLVAVEMDDRERA